jgi:hypothetical protein
MNFLTYFSLMKSKHPEILRDKAICRPSFFELPAKWITHLTKNDGPHQIAICLRTGLCGLAAAASPLFRL